MDKQIIIDDQKNTIHRLQQECIEKTNAIVALGEQLKRKEQECEELKEAIDGLLKIQYQLADSCNKYVQTLAEIKEIVRVNSINTCWTAINLCVDCNEIKECGLQSPFEKLKAIIQKISEREVENEI